MSDAQRTMDDGPQLPAMVNTRRSGHSPFTRRLSKHRFRFYAIVDLEATCWKMYRDLRSADVKQYPPEVQQRWEQAQCTSSGRAAVSNLVVDPDPALFEQDRSDMQEIIEFPILLLDSQGRELERQTFYIRPVMYPEISQFCTSLTGITQELVDACGISLEDALEQHVTMLRRYTHNSEEICFCTYGAWDLQIMLQTECQRRGIVLPAMFLRFINIKQDLARTFNWPRDKSLMVAMEKLGLKSVGRRHCGMDDCVNTAQVFRLMIQRDAYCRIVLIVNPAEYHLRHRGFSFWCPPAPPLPLPLQLPHFPLSNEDAYGIQPLPRLAFRTDTPFVPKSTATASAPIATEKENHHRPLWQAPPPLLPTPTALQTTASQ